jgi:4,5-DOPA dioxygenase extradiol
MISAYACRTMTDTAATRMPALYIGHGAPPLLDDALWRGELAAWARDLPRPTAILIVSAHWESAPVMLSATAAGTPLVYDFGGFAQRYYQMTYRTPDAGALAARVAAMMPDTEPVHEHPSRGLDHGAWVPLKIMYPAGDIPVLQMSLPTDDPDRLLELGRRLRPLRDEGVLIIGSGFLTHGLPFLREFRIDAPAPGWSTDFDAWAADALVRGDVAELASYRSKAPGMPYAHPTVEHFIPLFVTLGAASDPESPGDQRIDGYWMGLSKRSLQVA